MSENDNSGKSMVKMKRRDNYYLGMFHIYNHFHIFAH